MAGKISNEKIKQLQESFNKHGNKKGCVSVRTLKLLLKDIGESPSSEEVQDLINMIDPDGKGEFRFSEFLGVMSQRVG